MAPTPQRPPTAPVLVGTPSAAPRPAAPLTTGSKPQPSSPETTPTKPTPASQPVPEAAPPTLTSPSPSPSPTPASPSSSPLPVPAPEPAPAPVTPTLNSATLPRLLDPALIHLRDVTLIPAKSPGRSIRAHRFILAAASPVLRASLAADPTASVLTLSHADADTLNAALQFVYGCPDAINRLPSHMLWTALSTCVAYAILQPLDAVQIRIVQSVDFHNVFYHWGMAEKYNLDTVQLCCRNLVKEHFVDVSRQPEFLDICPQRLARVLRIHDLTVDSEDDVFQALERWLAFDVDSRAEHALQLLRLVRLPTMADDVLLRVCRSPYFGGHNEFYQLLLEALIRRTEVRIVHAPRIKGVEKRFRNQQRVPPAPVSPAVASTMDVTTNVGSTDAPTVPSVITPPSSSSTTVVLTPTNSGGSGVFKPLGVNDDNLLPIRADAPASGGHEALLHTLSGSSEAQDFNRKEDRTVLFEGQFPLRWYKSVRFRPRSPSSLLFTVVIPKWSTCRRRFISESRSFLNHKWSLWVDPFSSDPARGIRDPRDWLQEAGLKPSMGKGDDAERFRGAGGGGMKRLPMHVTDETDYISIYLCCESEMSASQTVEARVEFALFVVGADEEYGMERKVCVGRTFKSHGQAMGFRRHIRRNRLHSANAGLYSRDKDELVVGAHVVVER